MERSLLKYKKEVLQDKLEQLKLQITQQTGMIVVLIGQTDNATPHQDKLKEFQNTKWHVFKYSASQFTFDKFI